MPLGCFTDYQRGFQSILKYSAATTSLIDSKLAKSYSTIINISAWMNINTRVIIICKKMYYLAAVAVGYHEKVIYALGLVIHCLKVVGYFVWCAIAVDC